MYDEGILKLQHIYFVCLLKKKYYLSRAQEHSYNIIVCLLNVKDMIQASGSRMWLNDVAQGCDSMIWLKDETSGCDSRMWLEDVTRGCDSRIWLMDVTQKCGNVLQVIL